MKTVWKFLDYGRPRYGTTDERRVSVPSGAHVIHATAERDDERRSLVLTVWAVVDPDAVPEQRVFHVRGTGHPLGTVGRFVATTIDGPFVWHVFEGVTP